MITNEEELRAANKATLELWRSHLDLTVPLSIELGRTKLTAAAILALEINAIVQLARSTGEGVDVVTDSHRLARGEIVMIEDRTGIRINDISEQESR